MPRHFLRDDDLTSDEHAQKALLTWRLERA